MDIFMHVDSLNRNFIDMACVLRALAMFHIKSTHAKIHKALANLEETFQHSHSLSFKEFKAFIERNQLGPFTEGVATAFYERKHRWICCFRSKCRAVRTSSIKNRLRVENGEDKMEV